MLRTFKSPPGHLIANQVGVYGPTGPCNDDLSLLAFELDFDCACIFGVFDEDISSRPDGIRPLVPLMSPRLLKSLHQTQVLQEMVLPLLCHQFRSRPASWLVL